MPTSLGDQVFYSLLFQLMIKFELSEAQQQDATIKLRSALKTVQDNYAGKVYFGNTYTPWLILTL